MRKNQADKLARFLHDGEAIKIRCFKGLTESIHKEFSDWHSRVLEFLQTEMGQSHLVLFMHTIPPESGSGFTWKGKLGTQECNELGGAIEKKQDVLRVFISKFNK